MFERFYRKSNSTKGKDKIKLQNKDDDSSTGSEKDNTL